LTLSDPDNQRQKRRINGKNYKSITEQKDSNINVTKFFFEKAYSYRLDA